MRASIFQTFSQFHLFSFIALSVVICLRSFTFFICGEKENRSFHSQFNSKQNWQWKPKYQNTIYFNRPFSLWQVKVSVIERETERERRTESETETEEGTRERGREQKINKMKGNKFTHTQTHTQYDQFHFGFVDSFVIGFCHFLPSWMTERTV